MYCGSRTKKKLQKFPGSFTKRPIPYSVTTNQFVGKSAFTHKGGLHAHAVRKNQETYEHIAPEAVGNERRILISELSGGASILAMAEKHSLSNDRKLMKIILQQVQDLENDGVPVRSGRRFFCSTCKKRQQESTRLSFNLEEFRVMVEKDKDGVLSSEAIVKIEIKNNIEFTVGEGDGPIHALDSALKKALKNYYPSLTEYTTC